MLNDAEHISLNIVAVVIVAGILLTMADTALYPAAIGIGVIALLYLAINNSSLFNIKGFTQFLANPNGAAA